MKWNEVTLWKLDTEQTFFFFSSHFLSFFFLSSDVQTQPVRGSNSQHMEAQRLPATQSGLHYCAHTGIIKEADQRADYSSTAELQDFLFCLFFFSLALFLCHPLFLFVVFCPLCLYFVRPGTSLPPPPIQPGVFFKWAPYGSCTTSIIIAIDREKGNRERRDSRPVVLIDRKWSGQKSMDGRTKGQTGVR